MSISPLNCEYSGKKTHIKKAGSALRHVRTDFQSMMGEESLNSFIAEVPII